MAIVDNIISVKKRIKTACQKAGRNPDEITLIAVSKTFAAATVKMAVENGISHIGENRVQEAEEKLQKLGKIASWHLVGHLQTNKVKKALQLLILFIRLTVFISRRKLVNVPSSRNARLIV